jgi:uncharacterized protein (DUF3084 family)
VTATIRTHHGPIDQLTTMPSKQSIMGERYTLPAGIWNSVMSVSHFSFGALALKSRFRRLSGAGLISPVYEPCSMVRVGAARQADFLQKIGKRVCRSQGINAGRQVKALLKLPMPVLECVLRWVAELANGQADSLAQLDVEPHGSKSILV